MAKSTVGMCVGLAHEMIRAINESNKCNHEKFITNIKDVLEATPALVVGIDDGYEVYTFQYDYATILVWVIDMKVRSVKVIYRMSDNYVTGNYAGMSHDLARKIVKAVNERVDGKEHYGNFITVEDCYSADPAQIITGAEGFEMYPFQYGDMTILVYVSNMEVEEVKFVCW